MNLAIKSGWSPDDFHWDNIAGPHGMYLKQSLNVISNEFIDIDVASFASKMVSTPECLQYKI